MKSILCVSLLILLMPRAYAAALPGDSADGKRLHDANCMECHDTGIYTRKERLVRSLDALKKQLGSCSHMAKKEFSAIETQNIIKYLNDHFYQLKEIEGWLHMISRLPAPVRALEAADDGLPSSGRTSSIR